MLNTTLQRLKKLNILISRDIAFHSYYNNTNLSLCMSKSKIFDARANVEIDADITIESVHEKQINGQVVFQDLKE